VTERSSRIESVSLAVILTTVALSAGWASFTHVHDWTMRHAPTGTPDAFGWVNAVISELVPVAALLTIKRRRQAGQPIGYPLFLLIAAATLSLSAQLAVAQPSPSGWLLSAVPALAFMALVKLIFAQTSPSHLPATASTVASAADDEQGATVPAVDDTVRSPARPAGLVPVPAEAFIRRNGTPAVSEVIP
jgi:hypothetical protein